MKKRCTSLFYVQIIAKIKWQRHIIIIDKHCMCNNSNMVVHMQTDWISFSFLQFLHLYNKEKCINTCLHYILFNFFGVADVYCNGYLPTVIIKFTRGCYWWINKPLHLGCDFCTFCLYHTLHNINNSIHWGISRILVFIVAEKAISWINV